MVRVRGRTGASWRGMRLPQRLQEGLRQRHALRLHGWCIGSLILGVMWAVSHAQMALGMPSLALRYLVTLGVGYGVYLLVLRLWAAWLLRRRSDAGDAPDGLDLLPDAGWPALQLEHRRGRPTARRRHCRQSRGARSAVAAVRLELSCRSRRR